MSTSFRMVSCRFFGFKGFLIFWFRIYEAGEFFKFFQEVGRDLFLSFQICYVLTNIAIFHFFLLERELYPS